MRQRRPTVSRGSRSRFIATAAAAFGLSAACSLLAPPDSELVGKRPGDMPAGGGSSGSGGDTVGTAGVPIGEDGGTAASMAGAGGVFEEGDNAPGKPVDVGTPTGDWNAGAGLKTRWAAEVDATNAHRDYPRPHLTRHEWATLNGLWDYAIDTSADAVPKFDESKLLVPFPLESQLSGVAGSLGAKDYLWYHRVFQLPAAWRDRRVLLHFGAVDWDASVRVNGTEVVTHQGGYDGFSVDITDQLAAADEQDIVVRVADPTDSGNQPRGKQALVADTGTTLSAVSGIWQSVWLEPVPELRIENVHIAGSSADGAVTLTPGLSGAPAGTTFRAIVMLDGAEVLRGQSADGAALELALPSPQAWSPDAPNLYRVTLELEQNGLVVDSADSYFGLRSVTLEQDGGVSKLFLNAAPLLSMGVESQGYWPEGLYTAPTDSAVKADLQLVKNLGFNAIRVHEKMESERFYYWADRLGLLVWQDVPAGDNATAAARDVFSAELGEMVSERANHPSVAAWTLFTGAHGQTGADVPKLVASIKELAPSQLVVAASGPTDEGSGDLRDRPETTYVSCPVPDARGVVLGEYGSSSRAVTGHTWGGGSGAVQTTTDTNRVVAQARRARGLAERPGLSAAFFRQLTDVENELDGLVTYDRQVTKVTAKSVADAFNGTKSPFVALVQASEFPALSAYLKDASTFRYVTAAPAAQWLDKAFNDASWTETVAGIGDTNDVGARIRSKLAFGEIWARTTFTLDKKPTGRLIVRMMYDEETQVYVNGVLAADTNGWVSSYQDFLGSDAAANALVAGSNTIAVHTYNTNGGRYIDVGLWMTNASDGLRAPDAPASTTAGLEYADYDVALDSLPADLSVNTPRQVGSASEVGTYAPALAADDARALRWHGYIEVAEDGVYTFYVDTDDGARISIGPDRVAESLRNDGPNITRRAGNIALGKGKHEITIQYFANDNQGANTFGVTWAGPKFAQTDIDPGNLSH